jgi:hypothetical protein
LTISSQIKTTLLDIGSFTVVFVETTHGADNKTKLNHWNVDSTNAKSKGVFSAGKDLTICPLT